MNLVELARRTLDRVPNASLATVSPDGRPWNSPLYVAFDANFSFYWSSHVDAVHSLNIAAKPEILLVVFDSIASDQTGSAVYFRGKARELAEGVSVKRALDCLARRKNDVPKTPADFAAPYPRRVYQAVVDTIWTNVVKEADGHYFDERVVIDLIQSSSS